MVTIARICAIFMEGTPGPVFPSNKILSAQLMDVRWISLKEQTRALSKPCHQPTGLFVVILYTPLPPVTAQHNENPCSDLAKIDTAWLITHQNSGTILDIKKAALFFVLCFWWRLNKLKRRGYQVIIRMLQLFSQSWTDTACMACCLIKRQNKSLVVIKGGERRRLWLRKKPKADRVTE